MAAAFSTRPKFVHRANRDGTTDSICGNCFATISTSVWEAELERNERIHCCDPWTVEHFKKMARREVRAAALARHAAA